MPKLVQLILIHRILQGKISFINLKRVAKELGENLTDEELQVCLGKIHLMFNSYHLTVPMLA